MENNFDSLCGTGSFNEKVFDLDEKFYYHLKKQYADISDEKFEQFKAAIIATGRTSINLIDLMGIYTEVMSDVFYRRLLLKKIDNTHGTIEMN